MKIWLINVGEPIPFYEDNSRLLRYGLLFPYLLKNGHVITWWSSTFNHLAKSFREKDDKTIVINSQFSINLLKTIRYTKNISLKRILNHIILGHKLKIAMKKEHLPDVILCSMPTIEMAYEAVKFANKNNVPIIIDLRDMWPDSFLETVPKTFKKFGKFFLAGMFKKMGYICSHANSLIGITQGYLDWGLKYARREIKLTDKVYPLAYAESKVNDAQKQKGYEFWEKFGIYQYKEEFIISFIGSFGNRLEIRPVIEAAKRLGEKFKFVLAGSGEQFEFYKKQACGIKNIIFPGWINKEQVWTLLTMSKVGLAPYKSLKDFVISIPNKPIEYFSFGLPVISSLQGVLQAFLLENECGLTYKNDDFQSLLKSIKILFEDHEKYRYMSNNATNAYNEFFNAERVYSEMANHVLSIA